MHVENTHHKQLDESSDPRKGNNASSRLSVSLLQDFP